VLCGWCRVASIQRRGRGRTGELGTWIELNWRTADSVESSVLQLRRSCCLHFLLVQRRLSCLRQVQLMELADHPEWSVDGFTSGSEIVIIRGAVKFH